MCVEKNAARSRTGELIDGMSQLSRVIEGTEPTDTEIRLECLKAAVVMAGTDVSASRVIIRAQEFEDYVRNGDPGLTRS